MFFLLQTSKIQKASIVITQDLLNVITEEPQTSSVTLTRLAETASLFQMHIKAGKKTRTSIFKANGINTGFVYEARKQN